VSQDAMTEAPRLPLAIREGSTWCWAPLKPDAREECRITATVWNGEEWWIESESTKSANRPRSWNTLDSWAECAVLVTPGPQDITPSHALRADRRATSSDVAKALDVSAATVGLYARQGRIPYSLTPGRHRRFNIDEVRDALRSERKAPR
jgi:hypothetical protein